MCAGAQLLFLPRGGGGVSARLASKRVVGFVGANAYVYIGYFGAFRAYARQNDLRIFMPHRAWSGASL